MSSMLVVIILMRVVSSTIIVSTVSEIICVEVGLRINFPANLMPPAISNFTSPVVVLIPIATFPFAPTKIEGYSVGADVISITSFISASWTLKSFPCQLGLINVRTATELVVAGSRAYPIILPADVAFIAIPSLDEAEVKGSPI